MASPRVRLGRTNVIATHVVDSEAVSRESFTGVDGDVCVGGLEGQHLAEPDQAVLRRHVRRLEGRAHLETCHTKRGIVS